MKKHVNIFLIICFVFGITIQVNAFTFNRSLTVGVSGQDVFELQKILNSNPQTQVATNGVGSPGQETYYFGELTKQAIIKLQNLYASQILHPVNLFQGTGFVGPQTINFLNVLKDDSSIIITENQTPVQIEPITHQSNLLPQDAQFVLYPTTVQAGDTIYIGSEYPLKNTLFTLNNVTLTSVCQTEYVCEIKLPHTIEPSFQHIIKSGLGSIEIKIIQSESKKPTTQLKKISLTGENIITGQNFTATMNIYTPYGQFATQTQNNSFILTFPQNTFYQEGMGILVLENESGLQSDILNIHYEK